MTTPTPETHADIQTLGEPCRICGGCDWVCAEAHAASELRLAEAEGELVAEGLGWPGEEATTERVRETGQALLDAANLRLAEAEEALAADLAYHSNNTGLNMRWRKEALAALRKGWAQQKWPLLAALALAHDKEKP